MAERMPKPSPTIKAMLQTPSTPNIPPTSIPASTTVSGKKLVLIGYSQMNIAENQLKQNWPDINIISINPPPNNNNNRMLTYESADRLCDILNGDSGKAENDKYILNEGDVVVIDLLSNGLLVTPDNPSISCRPLSSKMMVDGREINTLHTVSRTKDKDGNHYKFSIYHENDIDNLVTLVAGFARYVEKRTKSLVVILGPLPRFPLPCCNNPDHTLTNGASNKTLLRLIRDLNFFVGVSNQINTVREGGYSIGLPFDVVVAGVSGLASPYDCAKTIKADNVHCHAWVINRLNNILISMFNVPTTDLAKIIGFHPTLPICTSITFSIWQKRIHYFNTRQILRHLPIDDGNLPNVTCSAKLCVSTHDPDLPKPDPSTKTIYGKKRPSTSSCSSSSGPSASRKPHIITPSHPAPRHNHNPSISRIVNRPIAAPQPLMSLSVPSPSDGSAANRSGIRSRLGQRSTCSISNSGNNSDRKRFGSCKKSRSN